MENKIDVLSVNKATYLYYVGIKPELRAENTDTKTIIVFSFPRSKEVHEALEEYNSSKLQVNLHLYLQHYSDLRKQMIECKKEYYKNKEVSVTYSVEENINAIEF